MLSYQEGSELEADWEQVVQVDWILYTDCAAFAVVLQIVQVIYHKATVHSHMLFSTLWLSHILSQ